VDNFDLKIIRLLTRDSRTSYKNIASVVGITPSATKERINKMVSNGIIDRFVVLINPVIFGYEKLYVLIVENIDKTVKEQDLFKRISLLGDVIAYSEELEGSYIFGLYVKDIAQDKIETVTDLLKPATVEIFFAAFRPPTTMKIHNSDLEIMKCLLSDARMRVEDIAKEASLSPRTVTRRLEKMRENRVLLFTISRDLSSTRLTGYMEFDVLINVERSRHQSILEKIYRELEEYLSLFQIGIREKLLSQYSFVQTFLQPN
jgi:DNA-binding Lrp family transcriptional regulator